MATPILNTITASIVTTLEAVTTGGGYNVTLTVEKLHEDRNIQNQLGDNKAVVVLNSLTPSDTRPLGHDEWIANYTVYVGVYTSEASETVISDQMAVVGCDVNKALAVDLTRGGYAVNTIIDGIEAGETAILINFHVLYRTLEGNPFAQ